MTSAIQTLIPDGQIAHGFWKMIWNTRKSFDTFWPVPTKHSEILPYGLRVGLGACILRKAVFGTDDLCMCAGHNQVLEAFEKQTFRCGHP